MATIIVCVLGLFIGICVAVWERSHKVDDKQSHFGYYIITMSLLVPIWLGVTQYFPNLERKAYLESFYNSNANTYQIAADKTATYLSTEEFTKQIIAGSLEKQALANTISQRIQEWRDAVVAYNQNLQTYRLFKANMWLGIFYPELPDYLKPLQIQ